MLRDVISEYYAPNEISEKVLYWGELWEDLVENFEKDFFGLKFNSPHLLIVDIIEALSSQGTINKDNKKLLEDELDRLMRVDPAITSQFIADFKLIKMYIGRGDYSLLVQACRSIQDIFTSGRYFTALFNCLARLLAVGTFNAGEEEQLTLINQHLIIELLIRGFHLDTIKDIPGDLFDKYEHSENVFTRYPHSINQNDFINGGSLDRSAYNSRVRNVIDNLSINDRINQLLNLYLTPPSTGVFIFQLANVRSESDFSIGNVRVYSPNRTRVLTQELISSSLFPIPDSLETFGQSQIQDPLNISITIPYVDVVAAKEVAFEVIQKSLDYFHFLFSSFRTPTVNKNSFFMVDNSKSKVYIPPTSSNSRFIPIQPIADEVLNQVMPHDVRNKIDSLITSSNSLSATQQKLLNALRWFNKAEKSNNYEDKLLNYWVVIESLIPSSLDYLLPEDARKSDINLVKEILPTYYSFKLIDSLGWLVHDIFRDKYNSGRFTVLDPVADQVIREVCYIDYTLYEEWRLEPFIQRIDEFESAISDRLLRNKIAFVKEIYRNTDNRNLIGRLDKINTEVKNELTLIYRLRNKIVHDAHYHSNVISSYTFIAKKHTHSLLNGIFQEYDANNPTKSLDDIIMATYIRSKRIMERLKNNLPVDFLNLDFL